MPAASAAAITSPCRRQGGDSPRGPAAALALGAFLVAVAGPAAGKDGVAMQAMDRSGLLLELRLDGNLADAAGTQRLATAHGTLAFAAGRQGACAAFDGSSWVDTGLLQAELGPEFTVECWVNPAAQQSPHADILGNHASEGAGFVLQQDGAATNDVYAAYGAGPGTWVITDAVSLTPGLWQHVALVKTREDLRFYLNGVLAASQAGAAPVRPSSLPVRVGLGYSAPERCFRGLIADVRIWNWALTDFAHAGIDPAAAGAVLAQRLEATPRPAAGALLQSWTLATADTRLTLGVSAAGALAISEVSSPVVGHNWVSVPVASDLPLHVEVAGVCSTLTWRLVDAAVDDRHGRLLALRFTCASPALEAVSEWRARPGPGPVQHSLAISNRSPLPLTLRGQPTFDLDLSGASALWSFHSDGITPDAVGVYQQALAGVPAGQRQTLRTSPGGEFIPYVVLDAEARHGLYVGLEWSFCRIETVTLAGGATPAVRLRGGLADRRLELAPGASFAVPPGFIGAYKGDPDDAGNSLRRWVFQNLVPAVLRDDPSYPKVQWNAFGATGKAPGSWDPVEAKYYPLIDDIAPLGFEEVMIDVAWWQGDEPDSDTVDWASGMRKAADYAHAKGLRFGLYWTDDLDMASPAARAQRAGRIRRLFEEYHADLWRSDCTRGEVIGPSYAATRGFYEMVDTLAREVPGFQWENCSGGGRIKDYGAMQRSIKIFTSDTYSTLHVRQAFHDSSFAFHPTQLEGHLGSTDGRFRPRGVAGLRHAFRSTSMGAPEWFLDAPNGGNGSEPWTQEERDAVRACVDTYTQRLRPLQRVADLYHILPRPDDRGWDGIQYHDPASGRGVVYLFKPAAAAGTQTVRLRGLSAKATYRLTFADGSNPPVSKTGAELLASGLTVTLPAGDVSELVFLEASR